MMNPLRIGMIGGGTVGGGVYEIIMDRLKGFQSETIDNSKNNNTHKFNNESKQNQRPMIITKICVRDPTKPRDFHINKNYTELVSNVDSILNDPSIDMVVEVMGGTDLAHRVVLQALHNGQHVVTANKALIAKHLDEIYALVKQQEGKAKLGFEAAVCGGIPIIHVLQSVYAGDVIHEVTGICNGTTNYMLGKMENGANFATVLKEAQDLGYAEADPTADVEGHDVQAKIAIMAKLAFGTTVPIADIPCLGISQLKTVDFEYAKIMNCTIKLVGTASRLSQYGEHDGPLTVYVTPKLVPLYNHLTAARGTGNVVAITSANLGTNTYTGKGAGRFPTANSVVADMYRIQQSTYTSYPFASQTVSIDNTTNCNISSSSIQIEKDYTSSFYVRISFSDSIGIIRKVGELCEKHAISIHSVLQNPILDRMAADFCIRTESCKFSQIQGLCNDVVKEEFSRGMPLSMPILKDD